MKNKSAGFYMMILTAVLAVIGVVFYLINCNTSYFSNLGVNTGLVACMVIAVILELVYVFGYKAPVSRVLDLIPVVCGVLMMVAFVLFISVRANSIASILTFENNAQTMSDLMSAIVGMVFCLLAVIFNIVGSFFKVVKDEK